MVKISEVARAAGVSTATVSRALSSPETVKPATRERVLRVVEELDYRPNALARQLRMQETKTVVVIVPTLINPLFAEAIQGVEMEAAANGYQVLVADIQKQKAVENYYMNAIRQRQIDGIISMSASVAGKIVEEVAEEYPLVVAIQSFPDRRIPNVSIDNAAAARAMMTHLLRMGHRKIAHITASSTLTVYQDRLDSYRSALCEQGLDVDEELICRGEATIRGGYEQMEALLSGGREFTAVFCAGDTMAMGAIKALKQHGLRVPQDVAVCGFDDVEQAAFWDPALTTIRQPKQEIGRAAFRKLLAKIRKEPMPVTRDLLPYELVIRDSCGYFL